jgi:hypothetical protein
MSLTKFHLLSPTASTLLQLALMSLIICDASFTLARADSSEAICDVCHNRLILLLSCEFNSHTCVYHSFNKEAGPRCPLLKLRSFLIKGRDDFLAIY